MVKLNRTIKVISGRHRGRIIPFLNWKYDDADITPQRVKEALFSMLGTSLINSVFLDLYSGSGQIAVEAISRGCFKVISNETDKKRFKFIKKFIAEIEDSHKFEVLNMKDFQAIDYLSRNSCKLDFVFLDPPYVKDNGITCYYDGVLKKIALSGILNDKALVIVQHFSKNILPDEIESLCLKGNKHYGSTSLTIYS